MPDIQLNYAAIAVTVVVNFFVGFIWYTPLFGRVWAKEMGFNSDEKPESGAMVKGLLLAVVGQFLLAWVFAHYMAAWDATSWGQEPTMEPMASLLSAAIFTWLGFYVPVDLNGAAWQKHSWKLFAINAGYHLTILLIAAGILTYWK